MAHPLLRWFHDAAAGRYPLDDGRVTFLPPLDDGREAVVSFTGHAVIASRMGADDLADLAPDGYGRASAPGVLVRLAAGGTIGVHDATMVALGRPSSNGPEPKLARTSRWDDHPRVLHARELRRDVEVVGDHAGFVTLGTGLGGRCELGIELVDGHRGGGAGRRLLEHARTLVARGEPVFAAVSPGNARSLRSFLAAGFVPIGSEVIVSPGDTLRP